MQMKTDEKNQCNYKLELIVIDNHSVLLLQAPNKGMLVTWTEIQGNGLYPRKDNLSIFYNRFILYLFLFKDFFFTS